MNVPLPRFRQKRSFAGFKTGFTAFVLLFLALWRLFLVDQRFHCKDTAKRFIRRLWKRFYGIRCSIFSTLENIFSQLKVPRQDTAKTVIRLLWNLFIGICCSIFSTLEVIFSRSKYCCQDTGKNVHSLFLKPVLRLLLFYFFTLLVIFSWSKVPLQRYGQNGSFAAF